MSWFSKFFDKDEEDDSGYEFAFSETDIPATTILRWFLYDVSIENENDLAEFIGLSRVSEEGDVKEREDSDNRLLDIHSLFSYIDHMAELSAEVVTSAQRYSFYKYDDDLPDKTKEQLEKDLDTIRDVYRAVAFSSLIGGISIAVRLGLLKQGDVTLAEVKLEGDIDEF